MVRIALHGFCKKWEVFVDGFVSCENMPNWERFWDDFIQKEIRWGSKNDGQHNGDYIENVALSIKGKKMSNKKGSKDGNK